MDITSVWIGPASILSPQVVVLATAGSTSIFTFFAPILSVFAPLGGFLTILGFIAWAVTKPGEYRHQWGKRFFKIGVAFVIIGYNLGGFISLVKYILAPTGFA